MSNRNFLTLVGVCTTLIVTQFPAPLSHVGVAALAYFLVLAEPHDLTMWSWERFWDKVQNINPFYQKRALATGLIVGAASVLPGGWVWVPLLTAYTTHEGVLKLNFETIER